MPPATIDPPARSFQEASPDEAVRLLMQGAVALDVRTEREHEEAGHLPGSLLLPLPLVSSAPAVLPEDGRPVIVYCDNGIRSRRAAAFLGDAGIPGVHHLRGGLAAWSGDRRHGPTPVSGPSPWLVANVGLAPRGARTLDVACGRGRHALLLAGAGYPVRAIDRDPDRVAALRASALRLRLPLDVQVVDLESGPPSLGESDWDLVLVFHYLHRPLFPSLVRALRPRGVLLYETFTTGQARHGRPTSRDFLLDPGELPRLVAPLQVIRQREGEFDGRHVASVVARKDASAAASAS